MNDFISTIDNCLFRVSEDEQEMLCKEGANENDEETMHEKDTNSEHYFKGAFEKGEVTK